MIGAKFLYVIELHAGRGLRFQLEFIRVNERVALGLTVAQWGSMLLLAVGAALVWPSRSEGLVGHRSPLVGGPHE